MELLRDQPLPGERRVDPGTDLLEGAVHLGGVGEALLRHFRIPADYDAATNRALGIEQVGRGGIAVRRPGTLRGLALVAHGTAGKTTLTEALLFCAGATTRLGRVADDASHFVGGARQGALLREEGDAAATEYEERAALVYRSFNERFWSWSVAFANASRIYSFALGMLPILWAHPAAIFSVSLSMAISRLSPQQAAKTCSSVAVASIPSG